MSIYCTYLTVYLGSKLPMFYIGSSSVTIVTKGYHGSVESKEYKEIWKSELKDNPHLFKTRILTKHSTRTEAFANESKFQKYFKVNVNPMFVNKSIVTHNGFFVGVGLFGPANGQYGKPTSEKQKQSARNRKGYIKTEQTIHKYKDTAVRLGLNKKEKNPMFGKTLTIETKQLIADALSGDNCKFTNSKWINDGISTIRLCSSEPLPIGWTFGRISTKMWITNGIETVQLLKSLPIPSGWRKGRTL